MGSEGQNGLCFVGSVNRWVSYWRESVNETVGTPYFFDSHLSSCGACPKGITKLGALSKK